MSQRDLGNLCGQKDVRKLIAKLIFTLSLPANGSLLKVDNLTRQHSNFFSKLYWLSKVDKWTLKCNPAYAHNGVSNLDLWTGQNGYFFQNSFTPQKVDKWTCKCNPVNASLAVCPWCGFKTGPLDRTEWIYFFKTVSLLKK